MLLSTPSRKRRNMSLWYIERNGKPWRITTACRLKLTSVAIRASSKLGTITTSNMKSSSGLRLLCTRRRSACSSPTLISSTISTSKYGRESCFSRSLSVSICEGRSPSASIAADSWR